MSHHHSNTSTSSSSSSSAARWLYTHILPVLLFSLTVTPASAAPIALSSSSSSPIEAAPLYGDEERNSLTSERGLYARALGRPYYGGGYYNGNGGGVNRKDLWKIVLGVIGGVALLLGLAYLDQGA